MCSSKSIWWWTSHQQMFVFVVLQFILCGLVAEGATSEGFESKTSSACEEDQLVLKCQQGEVIRILRANYGRFTVSMCNSHGQTEGWNLQCMSPKAKDIISERCDGRRECDMNVSNHVFGDPCPSTSKYAEVKYTCHLGRSQMQCTNSIELCSTGEGPRCNFEDGTQTTTTTMPKIPPLMPLNGSPRPPVITSVIALSPNQIELVWTQSQPLAPIHTTAVYIKDKGTTSGPSTLYVNTGKSLVIDLLKPNTTYIIFLKSFNAFGPSITSNIVDVTTPPLAFPDEIKQSTLTDISPRTTTSKLSLNSYSTQNLDQETPPTAASIVKANPYIKNTFRSILTSIFSSKNTSNVNIKSTKVTEISASSTSIAEGTHLSAFIRVASSSGGENIDHSNSSKRGVDQFRKRVKESRQYRHYERTNTEHRNSDNNFQYEENSSNVNQKNENASMHHLNYNHTSETTNAQSEPNLSLPIILAVSPTLETDVTKNVKMEWRKLSQEGDLNGDESDGNSQNNQFFSKLDNLKIVKDSQPSQNVEAAILDSSISEKENSIADTVSNGSTRYITEQHSTLAPLLQRLIKNDDLWQIKNIDLDFDPLKQRHMNNEKSSKDVHTNLTENNTKTDNINNENSNEHFKHRERCSKEHKGGNCTTELAVPLTPLKNVLAVMDMKAVLLSQSPLYQRSSSTSMMGMHTSAPEITGAYESHTRFTTPRIDLSEILTQKNTFTWKPDFAFTDKGSILSTWNPAAESATVKPELPFVKIDTSSKHQSQYKPDVVPDETNESINGVVDKFCEETMERGVFWPKTRFGRIAEERCPKNLRGIAIWRCLRYGWDKSGPDITDCISPWVFRLDEQIQRVVTGNEPSYTAAVALNEALRDQDLTSGDLKKSSMKLLPNLAQGFQREDPFENRPIKIERMKIFKKAFVSANSNLLSLRNAQSWQNLSRQDQSQAATSILVTMEDTGFHIASLMDIGTSEMTADKHLILGVNVIDAQQVHNDFTFPSYKDLSDTSWDKNSDFITISSANLRLITLREHVSLVFTLYKNMEDLMQPQSNTISSMPTSPIMSNGNEYNRAGLIEDENSVEGQITSSIRVVNTKIIAASINSAKQRKQLIEPVRFTLQHLQATDVQPVCSFWDIPSQSYKSGRWSQDGCRLIETNRTHTTCECDHLTNFAVLMDVTGIKLSQGNVLALRIITFVGCVISVICLMLSWITFLVFKNLQCDRNTIHKNLVFCLLLAEIVFLAGIAQTDSKILCSIVACILHYLFLGAFAWMCLEGIQLYVMLVEVFEQEKSRVHLYYLFGYGIPAVIVAISAGVYHQGYGTVKHCWLTTEKYFIWSFVGPALAVMLINIVMLSIAISVMCRHSNMSATMRDRTKTTKFSITESLSSMETIAPPKLRFPDLPAWLKGAIVLVVLLGLTWLLGVLYLNEESVVIAYFFTVLNSLQGLFIFVFHCLKNEKVQKEYRKVARRTAWLPNCIRVNYGGYTGVASSSPIGSSGSGNYLSKLFGQRNRNSAVSTNSSAKPFLSNNAHRNGTENSTSKDSSNTPSSLNGYVYNPSYSNSGNSSGKPPLSNNGVGVDGAERDQDPLANNYERVKEMALDLSEYVDCSVVDSEYVSEYCKHNMQISREDYRYSTGSEDSDSKKPVIPYSDVQADNLSTLSLASSGTDVLDHSVGDDLNTNLEEKPRKETLDPRLNLHQYIISVTGKNSNNNNNIDVKSINEKSKPGNNINASMNKLSKPIPSLTSIPEVHTSPQHSSAPNLQFKLDCTDKRSQSSSVNSPEDNYMTQDTSEPVYEEVGIELGSPSSVKSSMPNLSLNGLTVDCGDNTDYSYPIIKHSSDTDMHFSPFKFSANHC